MKNLYVLLLLCLTLLSMRCEEDPFESRAYDALSMSREKFESSTILLDSKPIDKSGKIYVKDHFLIINEPYEGFHIFDNTDPKDPKPIYFLKVLGSTDLSIKDNVIYANNAVDLIAISINSNFNSITVTKRVRDAFPELISPDGYYNDNAANDIVFNWKLKN